VVDRLAAESAASVQAPSVRKQLQEMGMTPATTTPVQFSEWIRKEIDHWGVVAKSANIRLE
jgi:tripartite-type tricarboxylate transporter receptor subunit TctC